jgi:DNA-directed RNA polymerase subunit RPC12/RpoP
MIRKTKICPDCGSKNTIKKGLEDGKQSYKCKDCNKRFRNKSRKVNILDKDIWSDFVFHKQTIRELKKRYSLSKSSIVRILHKHELKEKVHNTRDVYLSVDATYFGTRKRGTSWGVLVFRDNVLKENLWWKIVKNESIKDYLEGKNYLEDLGYVIKGVTVDGFLGLQGVFRGIPLQVCQFHIRAICQRYLTLNPLTDAGKELLLLSRTISIASSGVFVILLRKFYFNYHLFLKEKTINPLTGESWYTHERVRSAYFSLDKHFDHLFTFEKDILIAKTNNSVEAHFSHIKDIVRLHRGLSFPLKEKMIKAILFESTIAPTHC